VKRMLIPVRCFSCGKVLAPLYPKFLELIRSGKTPKEAFEELGIDRYCCRRTIMSHVDLYMDVVPFGPIVNRPARLKRLVQRYFKDNK